LALHYFEFSTTPYYWNSGLQLLSLALDPCDSVAAGMGPVLATLDSIRRHLLLLACDVLHHRETWNQTRSQASINAPPVASYGKGIEQTRCWQHRRSVAGRGSDKSITSEESAIELRKSDILWRGPRGNVVLIPPWGAGIPLTSPHPQASSLWLSRVCR